VIGELPLDPGAIQETLMDASAPIAVTALGGPGTVPVDARPEPPAGVIAPA